MVAWGGRTGPSPCRWDENIHNILDHRHDAHAVLTFPCCRGSGWASHLFDFVSNLVSCSRGGTMKQLKQQRSQNSCTLTSIQLPL